MPSPYRMLKRGRRDTADTSEAAIQAVESLLAQDALKSRIEIKRKHIEQLQGALSEAALSQRTVIKQLNFVMTVVVATISAIVLFFIWSTY